MKKSKQFQREFNFSINDFLKELEKYMSKKDMILDIKTLLTKLLKSKYKKLTKIQPELYKIYIQEPQPLSDCESIYTYLTLISHKDFKLFIAVNAVCSFALNPSEENYKVMQKALNRYVNENLPK